MDAPDMVHIGELDVVQGETVSPWTPSYHGELPSNTVHMKGGQVLPGRDKLQDHGTTAACPVIPMKRGIEIISRGP